MEADDFDKAMERLGFRKTAFTQGLSVRWDHQRNSEIKHWLRQSHLMTGQQRQKYIETIAKQLVGITPVAD